MPNNTVPPIFKTIKLYVAFLLVLTLQCNLSTAQSNAHPTSSFTYVEQMPTPPYNINEYIAQNMHYPELARENGIEGKVVIEFIVNKNGSISDAKVVRGIGGGCDEEALRIINGMPAWKPGMQKGAPINVRYSLPIAFKLQ